MDHNFNSSTTYLPAVAPDLLLVVNHRDGWQVRSISERLAAWLQIDSDTARGCSPASLFPTAIPTITSLATEVLEHNHNLTGIRLQLLPDHPEFLADVQFSGLTDDYLGQLVHISLRRETVARQQDIHFHNMVGSSPGMQEIFRKIRLYAVTDAAVIITGETGTGKELVAQALHNESLRHEQPFASLNCAAISEQLLESELFGHERGAFTGAVREHRGYFERANGGTLFLDEIGDMPRHTQTKLLRVLEDGQIQRVGGEKSRRVDVRFIGATNVPLERAVAEKRFRADLYHRLAVLRLHLPPLRDRTEDIPFLAELFLQQFNTRYGKQIKRLTNEALRLLQAYLWPGNIRELRNALERIVIESETEAISARAFTEWIQERQQFADTPSFESTTKRHHNLPVAIPYSRQQGEYVNPLQAPIRHTTGKRVELSAETIRQAYHNAAGNLSAAARDLGIHRATLYRHLQRLNLNREEL